MSGPITSSLDSSPTIRFENVRLGFEEGDILRGLSFQVQERETLVLLGETGTGKTLSLKLAAGLLRPSEGNIQVFGRDVSSMSERDLLAFRRQMGFVFQEGALFDSMTVGDNVAYRLIEDGVKFEEIEPRVSRCCDLSSWSTPWTSFRRSFPEACGDGFRSRER